jgi:hypothetical protein
MPLHFIRRRYFDSICIVSLLHSDADSPKISFMVVEGIAPEENFRHSFPFGQDLLPLEGVARLCFSTTSLLKLPLGSI